MESAWWPKFCALAGRACMICDLSADAVSAQSQSPLAVRPAANSQLWCACYEIWTEDCRLPAAGPVLLDLLAVSAGYKQSLLCRKHCVTDACCLPSWSWLWDGESPKHTSLWQVSRHNCNCPAVQVGKLVIEHRILMQLLPCHSELAGDFGASVCLASIIVRSSQPEVHSFFEPFDAKNGYASFAEQVK